MTLGAYLTSCCIRLLQALTPSPLFVNTSEQDNVKKASNASSAMTSLWSEREARLTCSLTRKHFACCPMSDTAAVMLDMVCV